MAKIRRYSTLDRCLMQLDKGLRAVAGQPQGTGRDNPAKQAPPSTLSAEEKQRAMRLMRVNHTGEVCAQALYQGQALTANNPTTQATLERCADEENDHLLWCKQRVHELGGHTSYLNPFFYTTSLGLGALAGLCGDATNLGFLAETEAQVDAHLQRHLHRLPANDHASRRIVEQMQVDERAHQHTAESLGARRFPRWVKTLMAGLSRCMTASSYRL